jgi:hypothetical protein
VIVATVLVDTATLDLEVPFAAELVDLEEWQNQDAQPIEGPDGHSIDMTRWVWKFHVFDAETGQQLLTKSGRGTRPLQVSMKTSCKISMSDTDQRYTAKVRKIMHALVGRTIRGVEAWAMIEEAGLPFDLCGKRCLLTLHRWSPSDGRAVLVVHALRDRQGTVWWEFEDRAQDVEP